MSWQQAWREGRTPWDAGAASPCLVDLVASGTLPDGHALVPGAGAGWDVLALASPTRHALGLDLAEGAAARFAELRDARGVPADRADYRVADFFAFEPRQRFDLIWDYTFLCAIEPDRRDDWAARIDDLLTDAGEIITLIFPIRDIDQPPPADAEGPPYPMHPDLVRDLLVPRFEAVELRPVAHSHPGREGMEWLGRWRRAAS